jgi:uncharacterized protein YegJ (DUF2314 family)
MTFMKASRTSSMSIAAGIMLLISLSGCDDRNPSSTDQSEQSSEPLTRSHWRMQEHATIVGVADDSEDRELLKAMAEARKTAPAARQRWANASSEDRERWSIKWAAPTVNHQSEHVWVKPLNWSAFRIEGVLISSPVNELTCGKRQGELVSFSVDELSDWLYLLPAQPSTKPDQAFEGGFTEKLLEARYGRPK